MSFDRPVASRKGALLLLGLLVLIAGALRLPGLDLKPLHSDEGVNGWFTLRLYWWDLYRYRPSDYHGPVRRKPVKDVVYMNHFGERWDFAESQTEIGWEDKWLSR